MSHNQPRTHFIDKHVHSEENRLARRLFQLENRVQELEGRVEEMSEMLDVLIAIQEMHETPEIGEGEFSLYFCTCDENDDEEPNDEDDF